MAKIPVIIDVDTGTDDAIAIICALQMKNRLDIRAFTTVMGNVDIEKTSQNTLNIVSFLEHEHKVAVGADKPLVHTHTKAIIHGETGLGDIQLDKSCREFHTKNSTETIYEEAVKYDGDLQILAVGPLTNIATALLKYPELKSLIKQITIMGGSLVGGNMTQTSEFNIYSDPEAARIVFNSGVPMVMVGLDVTLQPELPEWVCEQIIKVESAHARLSTKILSFMSRIEKEISGGRANLHDVIALCAMTTNNIIEYQKYNIDIECEGALTRGMTVADFNNVLPGELRNVEAATRIDVNAFWLWFVSIYQGKYL